MTRNTVYYAIFETKTHLEYHVSANKQEVRDHKSLSRRIPLDSSVKDQLRENWKDEAQLLELVQVDD